MSNLYNTVPAAHLKRSMFHLKTERNMTMDMGAIIPCYFREVLPGDVWKINQSAFIRVQPMVSAPFTPIRFYSEFWFFPTRVLMQKLFPEIVDAWETFIFGGPNGDGKNAAGQTPSLPIWIPNKKNVRLAGAKIENGVQSHKTGNADAKGSLWDYFAHPVDQGFGDLDDNGTLNNNNYLDFCPLAFEKVSYNFLWNTFKRNENLEQPVDLLSDDVQFCKWKHDRYNSSLPFQQRGDPVALPLGTVMFSDVPADVAERQLYAWGLTGIRQNVFDGLSDSDKDKVSRLTGFGVYNAKTTDTQEDYQVGSAGVFGWSDFSSSQQGVVTVPGFSVGSRNDSLFAGVPSNVTTDSISPTAYSYPSFNSGIATNASHNKLDKNYVGKVYDGSNYPFDILAHRYPAYTQANVDASDMRLMFQTQKFMERAARGGVRYIEGLKSFFGTSPRNDVLQLPQFIGGLKQNIIINEVLQTSETQNTPQGNIAGRGISAGAENIGVLSAKEHGYILGICWIKPDLYYMSQGIKKECLRRSKFDFYWPQFAHLSEQPIKKCELFASPRTMTPAQMGAGTQGILGYTGIYNEYRSSENEVCGEMRDTFDYWHLARKFSSAPELGADFITCFPRKDIFAVQDEDEFMVDLLTNCKVYRPMPHESNPGLLDHF